MDSKKSRRFDSDLNCFPIGMVWALPGSVTSNAWGIDSGLVEDELLPARTLVNLVQNT